MNGSDLKLPSMEGMESYYRPMYSELRELKPDALIPELQKIVIDYAVDIKDYEILKKAFMTYTVKKDDFDINEFIKYSVDLSPDEEAHAISRWRAEILENNRNTMKNIHQLDMCGDCKSERRAPYLDPFTCMNDELFVHHYYLCILCYYETNLSYSEDIQNRDRSCGYH